MNGTTSSRLLARTAGAFYLFTIVGGFWAMAALNRIVVPGDSSATIRNMLASETVFRCSALVNVMAGAAYVVVTALLYELLAPVSRAISRLAAYLSLVGCALWTLGGTFQLVPIFLAHSPEGVNLALRLHNESFVVTWLFFGPYCLLIGYLIFMSTYLPKAIGILLMLAGVCDVIDGISIVALPRLADMLSSFILVPALIGEAALALWLFVVGFRVEKTSALHEAAS